jgi:ribonuclease PH
MMRANKRPSDSIRPVRIKTDYLEFADGSALIEIGKTKVIAAASLDEKSGKESSLGPRAGLRKFSV